jgi:DNA-binding SARP family transcriptional activator/predicted ATPase
VDELRIHALGGLRLTVGPWPLPGAVPAKGRALLTYLAVTREPAGRSRVAGLLWSDLTEDAARANLRLTLTKSRPAVPHLQADRTAVWLDGPLWSDVAELDRLAAGTGEARAVIDLFGGDFLDGVELSGAELFDEWAVTERSRIRASAFALLDGVIADASARRDVDSGVRAARRILQVDPCHEQAHRQLIRLFADAGKPSAALAQYDTYRQMLDEELGVSPPREVVDLAGRLRQTEVAAPLPEPALPRAATSLIGREAELTRLDQLIEDTECALVTVLGPGGIGKSRVALELATRHRAAGHPAFFVSLAGAPAARGRHARDLIVSTVAAGLGVALEPGRDPLESLAERLAGPNLLIVADNLEHLQDSGRVLASLLSAAPGVTVVATSRRRLGVGMEWVLQLGGLAVPPTGALGDLRRFDAIRLFLDRARAAGAGDGYDLADVAALCRAVDGVPLAIELAARRAPSVPVSGIGRRLSAGLDLLSGSDDPDRRHRSLRATLDWSWDLLAPDLARAFARLSVFPAGFTAPAAEAVADVALRHLSDLVDQSLLSVSAGRYSMHQLVLQYAAERLGDRTDEARALAQRHASWMAQAMADADPEGLDTLDIDDVRAATAWMIGNAEPAGLDAYLARLTELYRRRSLWGELRTIAESVLRRPELSVSQRSDCLEVAAEAHRQIGNPADAIRLRQESLAVLGRALPSSPAGRVAWAGGYAVRLAGLRLGWRGSQQRRQLARVRSSRMAALGELYYVGEQFDRLPAVGIGGYVEGRLAGDPGIAGIAEIDAAVAFVASGRLRLARHFTHRALAGVGQPGVSPAVAGTIFLYAVVVWSAIGAWDELFRCGARAEELCRDAALHRAVDQALLLQAIARYHIGEYADAMRIAEGICADAERRGSTATLLWAHLVRAETAVRADLLSEVEDQAREALRLAERVEQRIDRVRAIVILARLALATGRFADGERLLTDAARELGNRPSPSAYTLEAHAGVPELAVELIEHGRGDRRALEQMAGTGVHVLAAYARAVPIAVPRVHLLQARLRAGRGQLGAARRGFDRAQRQAQRLGLPWEQAEAGRRKASLAPAVR